jgi:2-polyprenyl-6-methoxyphenol hydroxylase-like FAD-dependent oxidoreductase
MTTASNQPNPAESVPADETVHDLLIVGAGSVGLTMAAVWAQLGREAVIVEKHQHLYGLPRVGHIDHEIMRLLQTLGAEGPVVEDAYEPSYYRWVTATGETLLEFPWGEEGVSGWHSDFMQNSAILEQSLLTTITAEPGITRLAGWEAVELVQYDEYVELVIEQTELVPGNPVPRRTGVRRRLLGRYLVACDGANSRVRNWLGINRDDLGFNERWLVADARIKREFSLDFDSGQICDPRRPVTVLPLGKSHRRWEWHLRPTEDASEFTRPERLWELLGEFGLTPDDLEPVRQLVYTFEARIAREWRSGRVFLAGDAAHTMPPFMGQGMCSGMRDAKNLAWKLDLVLSGLASDQLLDTYQAERAPHVRDWTTISIESGKIPCIIDPDEARRRDELFSSGYRPPIPDFPQLETGVLHRDADGNPIGPAGELGVQARVTVGDRTDLFDRLHPARRFAILAIGHDPRTVLHPDQITALSRLGISYAVLRAPGEPGAGPIDAEGKYADYFAERGICAVVTRPDFYVFGGVATIADLPALVDDLLDQVLTATSVPLQLGGLR